jgi:hypothetical protein
MTTPYRTLRRKAQKRASRRKYTGCGFCGAPRCECYTQVIVDNDGNPVAIKHCRTCDRFTGLGGGTGRRTRYGVLR